ncbi:MAG: xanthine dehydrogenase family protein molybdopterin-binding subunit [Solirubrobacteraceae bacterium]
MRDLTAYNVDHEIEISSPNMLGARVKRVEDPRLITGHGCYVSDVEQPGMLHAAFVRSPVPHAVIRGIDVEAARDVSGVVAVYTGSDLRDATTAIRADAGYPTWQTSARPILAVDRVRFVGEAIALVVAEDRYVAEDAASLVEVDLEPLAPVMKMDVALSDDVQPLHEGWKTGCYVTRVKEAGDVDAAFTRADHTLKLRLTTQRYAAVPMEGRAVVADYNPHDDALTVWDSTQVPHLARTGISQHLGHPEHHIRVIAPDVGGGFGLKCMVFPEEIAIPFAARALRRPVKWVEDRVENLTASAHARDARDDLEIAFNDDGEILGLKAEIVIDSGAYSVWPYTASMELGTAVNQMPGPYRFRNYRGSGSAVATNKAPHGPYRGVSRVAATFAMERVIDEVARFLDMDPIELRKKNLVRSDEFPWESPGGYVFDSGSYVESMDKLAEISDIAGLRERQRALRSEGRYLGLGVSCFNEQTAHSFAEYAERGTPVVVGYDKAHVRMDADGKVTVFVDTHAQGQGHETSYAQLVAAQLSIPLEDVRVRFGDTETAPAGMGTFASRSTAMGGGSIQLATRELKAKLTRLAAHMLEAAPEDLRLEDGRFFPAGTQWRGVSIREIAQMVHLQSNKLPPNEDPLLETSYSYRGDPGTGTFPNCAQLAVVEVDPDTGKVTLVDFFVVMDCGPIINPLLVEGQIHGGVAQGVGGALFELAHYDDDSGQPLFTTFLDYLLPGATDVSDIQLDHLYTPSPWTPGGVKGVAEAGTTGSPAAIANAVADALTGFGEVLVDELPLTPERVYAYIQRARAGGAPVTRREERMI